MQLGVGLCLTAFVPLQMAAVLHGHGHAGLRGNPGDLQHAVIYAVVHMSLSTASAGAASQLPCRAFLWENGAVMHSSMIVAQTALQVCLLNCGIAVQFQLSALQTHTVSTGSKLTFAGQTVVWQR